MLRGKIVAAAGARGSSIRTPGESDTPRCRIRVLAITAAVALLLAGCRRPSRHEAATTLAHAARWEDHRVGESDAPGLSKSAIAAWNRKSETAELVEITTFPVAGRPDLVGAICDYEREWWGFMTVYATEDGSIAWQAECENQPGEQSVRTLRSVALKGFSNPVIEVLGETHMGNGDLYLYELQERKLVLILETRAVDDHSGDRYYFKGGRLERAYRDIDLDGFDDLDLTGTVVDQGEDLYDPDPESKEGVIGTGPASEFPCRKVFFWDPGSHRFVENTEYRAGLEDQPEADHSAKVGH
jgi:hypothetical protein